MPSFYLVLALYEHKPAIDVIDGFNAETPEKAQEKFSDMFHAYRDMAPNAAVLQLNKQETMHKFYVSLTEQYIGTGG